MSDMIMPYGTAKDGTIFNITSPEVQAELTAYSTEITLEVAIGNVVMKHDQAVAAATEEVA